MHDLKQIAADAKAVIAAQFHYKRDDETRPEERLAAFARDLTDETPVGHDDASERWLAEVSPVLDGKPVFVTAPFGGNLNEIFYADGYQSLSLGNRVTRGRVRAFALALGLELREGEG